MADDPEARDALDRELQNPVGTNQHREGDDNMNTLTGRPTGTSHEQALRKLRQAAEAGNEEAAALRAAVASEANEVEWMLNAREAERALGRMILAAREAGELATGRPSGESMGTLHTFDIDPKLAADSVVLAGVPDDVWQETRRIMATC